MKTKKDFISWWNAVPCIIYAFIIFSVLWSNVSYQVSIMLSILMGMQLFSEKTEQEWNDYRFEELEKQLKNDSTRTN